MTFRTLLNKDAAMEHCLLSSIKHYFLPRSIVFLLLVTLGCSIQPPDRYTVGIITKLPESSQSYIGFKKGMSDLGYVEGRDLFYIYREVPDASQALLDATIKDLLDQDIDLLLIVENDITLQCKELTEDTGTPILFISTPFPEKMGLVNSLSRPGGNLTGVRLPETANKTLEWMSVLIPETNKVYLPYNPDDHITAMEIRGLRQIASDLGIVLVFDEVHSVEETLAAIESLGKDFDAIFRLPSCTLNPGARAITQTGLEHGIPSFSSLLLDEDVLFTFSGDFTDAGQQAARMAQQIFKGIKPSDLPVETSEAFLILNLQTAKKTGITVPQEVLSHANTIIR
jgi:putative ABC transport system substrate-binding protein